MSPKTEIKQFAKKTKDTTLDVNMNREAGELRLNLHLEDTAFRLNISKTTVSDILNQGLPALAKKLNFLVQWPNKDSLVKNMPVIFKKTYPRCISIIDCFECYIRNISSESLLSFSLHISSDYWKDLEGSCGIKGDRERVIKEVRRIRDRPIWDHDKGELVTVREQRMATSSHIDMNNFNWEDFVINSADEVFAHLEEIRKIPSKVKVRVVDEDSDEDIESD
ncbi:Hypothetical predicted protein [Mytilus galloprovincialis]|uniref:Uncharacterized protein n=1 Tax=Mytilus galloprovincialis TaxID=29158 RepID=A0A8B6GUS8_MYTGA|nr:Hypothetical predicted protein [Mytilus galloprovincialis]